MLEEQENGHGHGHGHNHDNDPIKKYYVDSADEADEEHHTSGSSENEVEPLVLAGLANPDDKKRKRKFLLIYPNDRFRFFWDIVLSITLLIFCIVTPYYMALAKNDYLRYDSVVELCMDLVFLIDIFINFNSAIVND